MKLGAAQHLAYVRRRGMRSSRTASPSRPSRSVHMANRQRSLPRMGTLPPRYAFFLNAHRDERFTRCPRCHATTRLRKIPLVIHVDSFGLMLLRKTCRLCVACEMLIAHEFELNAEVQRVASRSDSDVDMLSGINGDALLYLGPAATLTRTPQEPSIYLDAAYRAEINRRNQIRGLPPLSDAILSSRRVRCDRS